MVEFHEAYELWTSFFIFFCLGFVVTILEIGRSVHDGYDPRAFRHGILLIFLFVFVMGMITCGGLAYDSFQASIEFGTGEVHVAK
jgi:hypothetical protein